MVKNFWPICQKLHTMIMFHVEPDQNSNICRTMRKFVHSYHTRDNLIQIPKIQNGFDIRPT